MRLLLRRFEGLINTWESWAWTTGATEKEGTGAGCRVGGRVAGSCVSQSPAKATEAKGQSTRISRRVQSRKAVTNGLVLRRKI